MKVFIVLALLAIIAALASAGLFMLRPGKPKEGTAEPGRDKRMARALALRVGLSIALFLLILLAYALGWIQPSGVPLRS
ncbi:twin transmembrane helix small protein [Ideonella sp.]|uniref:twin transmembrane helix small protein n=1 Tax=Ideonella sp. TaxID=1929293 RepID=UPI002B47FF08|nr:twin transmembrane helix small protein [Ideonella sp.]HJV67794.1 twin transmembrane helix small protein [Ideonella sp.]